MEAQSNARAGTITTLDASRKPSRSDNGHWSLDCAFLRVETKIAILREAWERRLETESLSASNRMS
jgi:hypothetical protein